MSSSAEHLAAQVAALAEEYRSGGDRAELITGLLALTRTDDASALMRAAEDAARTAGKAVLVLDTVTGGDAERLYTRLGWMKVGVIPNYALWPQGGLCATTVFYKQISPA